MYINERVNDDTEDIMENGTLPGQDINDIVHLKFEWKACLFIGRRGCGVMGSSKCIDKKSIS